MRKHELTTGLVGVAGEYLVAAELSRRGYIASLTLKNTRGIDILAASADASRAVSIQVKTSTGNRNSWILNSKAETLKTDNFFYVLVKLAGVDDPAEFFVVPSEIVANYCCTGHAAWLASPGAKGQKRNDSNMRKFDDYEGVYRNRWELLGLD